MNKTKNIQKHIIILIILIAIVTISLLIVAFYSFINNKRNDERNNEGNDSVIQYVSMDDIVTIMEENTNYIIVDVRTHSEYDEGHIPNAVCIPNETIEEEAKEKLPNKNQLILVYCRSGNRSKQSAEKLSKMGYNNIIEFGGIINWKGEIEK